MINQSKKSIPDVSPDSASIYLQEVQGTNGDATPQTGNGVDWFEQFFSTSSEMLCIVDGKGYFRRVNDALSNFLGYSSADLITQRIADRVDPLDIIPASELLAQAQQNNVQGFETRVVCSNGEIRWISWSTTHLGAGMVLGIVRDITNDKLAAEALQLQVKTLEAAEAAGRYQANVLDNLYDAVISSGPDFTIRSWNRAAERLYGLTADQVKGHRINEFIEFDLMGVNGMDIVKELREKGSWNGEVTFIRPGDGKHIHILSTVTALRDKEGNITDTISINKEITDKRLAQLAVLESEEALRISEERYRSVVHALGEGITMFDREGHIITCNRSAEEIMGMTAEVMESLRKDILYIHEDGSPFPLEELPVYQTLRTGRSFKNVIVGVQRLDGALVWISCNSEPIYYHSKGEYPDAVVASFVDITEKKAAEIELQRSQQQLREYSERITNILDSITDGFIAVDKHFNILLWNHAVEQITGIRANNAIGTNIEKVFPEFIGNNEYPQYIKAIESGTTVSFEHFIIDFDRWFETSVYPFEQGVFIYFRDITERKKNEELLKLEKEVLKINAQPNVSLKTAIDYLLEGLERTYPGMLCSVIVLNDDKETIHTLSAPSLPSEYSTVINGTRVGPKSGSCGTAMYRKEKVITEDILTDPLWDDFRESVMPFKLRACWSFPVMNAKNEVLATIAAYYRTPRTPSKDDLTIMERASNLLRIIIENKIAEIKIRVSNERYLLVTKATNDAIWDWDVLNNTLYWGEGFYTLFGYRPGYIENPMGFWESCIHDDDRDRVLRGLNEFVSNNNSQVWEAEYRFRKANGQYALVNDRGFLIFDHTGKINRMVGSMQDITEKKEMERKLLKQELDKQKLVAQAVVNAQEKERADIGKELHDNVNQILSTAKLYLELARTEEEERLDLINRSTDNISSAINEIRSISRSLVPPSVGDLGLIDSIEDLVENTRATKKLQVSFDYAGEIDDVLDEKRKLMLFRIVQEQVNNVLRHSKATHLHIGLTVADNIIDLWINDDGEGFDMEKVKLKKGVGLSNIISRAELFNGRVTIKTAPGKGCSLNISIPISNL